MLSLLVLVVAAGVVVPVMLVGGGKEAGRPRPAGGQPPAAHTPSSSAGVPSSLPSYRPLPDGSGFSTQPMDQPFPVPDLLWPGLRDSCEWMTADLARSAGGTGVVGATEAGCSVHLAGAERVQVTAFGPYEWVTDPARFMRPVTIAGLEAREYAFTGQGAGECGVQVNTRAPSSLTVTAWNPQDRDGGSAEQRCQVARRVAEAVARRYVPLAGGTPWARTPQQPDPGVGTGKVACELVGAGAANYGGTDPRAAATGTDPLGTTCTYEGNGTSLVALVTDGPDTGLAEVEPRVPEAQVSERRLASLPARVEDADTTCAVTVEFAPGRVFTITYEITARGLACRTAEVVAGVVLTDLINASTS